MPDDAAAHNPAPALPALDGIRDETRLTDGAQFPTTASTDSAALIDDLVGLLDRHEQARSDDPFSNPVLLLALDIGRRLGDGSLSYADVEQTIQRLTVEAWGRRARRLADYVGETDPAENERRLGVAIRQLAKPRTPEEAAGSGSCNGGSGNGDAGKEHAEQVSFEVFRDRVESEVFGLVITAHPTFTQPTELMRALATLAAGHDENGEPIDEAARQHLLRRAFEVEHRPDADLSLDREHALSLEVIGNMQAGLRRAYDIILAVGQELYPQRWQTLVPRLATVATWVGYDLDGRSDIRWTATLQKRLVVQRVQLAHYLAEVRALHEERQGPTAPIVETLELMESRLALALSQVDDEIQVFGQDEDLESIARISKRMYGGLDMRLTEAGTLTAMIDRAIDRLAGPTGEDGADDGGDVAALPDGERDRVVRRLAVLRAEMANYGLGAAHTHVRINSTQVHNSIRKAVGLVSDPNDPRYRISYLDTMNELLETVEPVTVNFGSILHERTSVKQLFMVIAQMLKYAGRTAPVRFLIAETESAFTCLTALYYARLFGVEDHVDISPLFETERALEVGSRVIDQLLENPHYRAYVEKRGRICVQTGYSDAGRFIGQTPANASIERMRLRLTRVIATHRRERGLKPVQLIVFDTHGESIGRGAHPENFEQRLANIDTAATRGFVADNNLSFKQEMSFQGGDGYLPFVNGTLSFAVITRLLEHALRHGDNSTDDPFYDEAAYIREFFTTVSKFQVGLMNDRNYGILLTALGTNLLFQSGSRPLKRQHEDPSDIDQASADQLRAIPHNAVLQQMGLLANTIGGVGAAIAKDPSKFRRMYHSSARMRQIMGLVEYGLGVSDPQIMKAYIDSMDPGLWIIRAAEEPSETRAEDFLRLGDYHEGTRIHERQTRVYRQLACDALILGQALDELRDQDGAPVGCLKLVNRDCQVRLRILHALRIALIHEVFLLAMRTPEFSGRHGVTQRQLILRLLHLDVEAVVEQLQIIFPLDTDGDADTDFGEPATYLSDEAQSYAFENERIFKPMLGLYRLMQRITTATSHHIGFFG